MVQGHVDEVATCIEAKEDQGSWRYTFRGQERAKKLIVDKGSICINGVSLTIVDTKDVIFQVAIIPYTYENTTFKTLKPGDLVNIEYDIIGKYILKNYIEKL
jgi:riboflavin synthase